MKTINKSIIILTLLLVCMQVVAAQIPMSVEEFEVDFLNLDFLPLVDSLLFPSLEKQNVNPTDFPHPSSITSEPGAIFPDLLSADELPLSGASGCALQMGDTPKSQSTEGHVFDPATDSMLSVVQDGTGNPTITLVEGTCIMDTYTIDTQFDNWILGNLVIKDGFGMATFFSAGGSNRIGIFTIDVATKVTNFYVISVNIFVDDAVGFLLDPTTVSLFVPSSSSNLNAFYTIDLDTLTPISSKSFSPFLTIKYVSEDVDFPTIAGSENFNSVVVYSFSDNHEFRLKLKAPDQFNALIISADADADAMAVSLADRFHSEGERTNLELFDFETEALDAIAIQGYLGADVALQGTNIYSVGFKIEPDDDDACGALFDGTLTFQGGLCLDDSGAFSKFEKVSATPLGLTAYGSWEIQFGDKDSFYSFISLGFDVEETTKLSIGNRDRLTGVTRNSVHITGNMVKPGNLDTDPFFMVLDSETGPVCGNDILEDPEECDDGNIFDGDGCSAECTIEVPPPEPVCGNNILEGNEQCDDGNTLNGDGCNAVCIIEFCGDSILQTGIGEQCDDGNNQNGDGCNAVCNVEFCGDGILQPLLGEQCDDGNNVNGDGCSSSCQAETTQVCGNNLQEGTEVCDGFDLAGKTCTSLGFFGGALSCQNNCIAFDTSACTGQPSDPDGDGVFGTDDFCPGSSPDGITLNPNQYAQNIPYGPFESGPNNDQSVVYDMQSTNGCTCSQIVSELGAGKGHLKKGCSPSVMEEWSGLSAQPDRLEGVGSRNNLITGAAISALSGGLSGSSLLGVAGILAILGLVGLAGYRKD